MGRSLDMDVIAEGIETEQQLAILRGRHCSEVQGFLLGRPIPSEAVAQYIDETTAHKPWTMLPEEALI